MLDFRFVSKEKQYIPDEGAASMLRICIIVTLNEAVTDGVELEPIIKIWRVPVGVI